jgi:hypothetical protein
MEPEEAEEQPGSDSRQHGRADARHKWAAAHKARQPLDDSLPIGPRLCDSALLIRTEDVNDGSGGPVPGTKSSLRYPLLSG